MIETSKPHGHKKLEENQNFQLHNTLATSS